MHSALLSISKLLLNLWIRDQHIDVGVVDKRIKLIDVPTEVAHKSPGIHELKDVILCYPSTEMMIIFNNTFYF